MQENAVSTAFDLQSRGGCLFAVPSAELAARCAGAARRELIPRLQYRFRLKLASSMITVAIQRSPTYLRAVASGTADLAENCSAVVFVADVLRRTSSTRLLFDMRALRPGFGKADVLQVISTLYSSLPAMDKIAVVVAPGTSQGIVLEVARHRNVAAEEFSSTQEAEEWLQL